MLTELLFFISFFLVVGYITIFLLIYKFGSKMPQVKRDEEYTPLVSIVIPTLNEKEIIEKRIENLIDTDYPKNRLDVVFVDDSTDNTPDIIKKYQKRYPFIRLLKQKKPGFNNALNQGYSASKGEIVIKSDCTALPRPDALRKLVSNFADSRIGAACGIHTFSDNEKSLEREFKGFEYKIQQVEAYFHSSLISHGAFGAYRKTLIPKLRPELTSDDSEVIVNVVKQGYRAIIDPRVKCVENAPERFRERRRQKDRRAGGVIRVILSNLNMFFNRQYGMFGFITLPLEFFILVITPVLLFLLFILSMCYVVTNPMSYVSILILLFFGLVFVSIKLSAKIRAIFDTYLSCFLGLFQAFTKKKKWK